jgi:hypothetical protein
MSILLTTSRPTDWNFPLFIHVLGAMILVGGVLTGASALAFAGGNLRQLRFGYWSLLLVGLPGLILMRLGAASIWHKHNPNHSFLWAVFPHRHDVTWIKIGGTVADFGGGLLVLALILGWFGLRRMDGGQSDLLAKVPVVSKMSGETLLRLTMLISLVLLAGYVLAVWAMAGKPG